MIVAVQSKQQLFDLLRRNQVQIKALGVKKIGLFGSFVRDETTKHSDVDLLVEFNQGQKTFDNFMQLSFLLEDLLQRPVELVTPEALSPHMGPQILENAEYVSLSG
jgi:predicted nucleotidyltransferase